MKKFHNKVVFSAILLYTALVWAQTVNVFPKFLTGLDAAKPDQCDVPSFYQATDTNNLYVCNAGSWQLIIGGTPTTVSVSAQGGGSLISFGSVQSGTISGTQNILISNTSTSGSFTVTGVTFAVPTGASYPSSDFSGPNLSSCNISIPAGGSCLLPTTTRPSTNSIETATATVTTTAPVDPQNPLVVSLLVTGTPAITFPITVNGLGLGSGSISDGTNTLGFNAGQCSGGSCTLNYPTGTIITYIPTANTGSTFSGFTGAGLSSTNFTFTVTQAQTITATFDLAVADVVLTVGGNGQGGGSLVSNIPSTNGLGTLSCTTLAGVNTPIGASGCNGTYAPGSVVRVTAAANATSVFGSWSGFPGCTTALFCDVTLGNQNINLTANFSLNSSNVQIAQIQTATNCAVSGTTMVCNMASAQQIGDINICAGSWPDNTTTVVSLIDTGGNSYNQVPTFSPKTTTGLSQVLYYANGITAASAGARNITMTLSTSGASAVAATSLFSNHDLATANSYASTPVTLPNNQEILVGTWTQLNSGNGPGPVTSITDTAGGLTWTRVEFNDFNSTQGSGTTTREEVWRAVGTGATGVVTAHWGVNTAGHAMSISSWSGADIGGGGANAIGITAKNTGTGTAAIVSMGTFGSASNGTYALFGTGASKGRTPGAGMTSLGADQLASDEWAAGNVAMPAQTLASSAAWGGISVEIKASGAAGRRDMRCIEYAGIKQSGSPIDTGAAAVGSSTTPASGNATTGTAGDLLTGFTASLSSVNAVSPGFTQQLKNTFGDDEEDRQGVALGTVSNFQPTLTSSANWIATQVAWLPQSASAPPVFSLSLIISGNGNGGVVGSSGTPVINGNSTGSGCTGSCSSQVNANSSVPLTATPLPGSVFVQWLGVTGCSTAAQCTVPNITASQNVTAVFALSGTQQYYVATSGSNSNNGTSPSTPWQTIATAIARANLTGAATINVAAGTYTELATGCAGRNADICVNRSGASSTSRFRIQCTTPFSVPSSAGCLIRNGSSTGGITVVANNVDVVGFDYGNDADAEVGIVNVCNGNPTAGACPTGNSVHFINNYIHDIGQTNSDGGPGGLGCPSFGAVYAGSTQHGTAFQTDVQIIGNRISNYGDQSKAVRNGGTCNFTHGIYAATPNVVMYNNVVIQAATFNIQLYNQACNSVISFNTLDQAGKGNIVIGNGTTCAQGPTGRITINGNIMESAPSGAISLGTGGGSPCTAASRVQITYNLVAPGMSITNGGLNGCTDISGTTSEAPSLTFSGYNGSSLNNSYVLSGSSIAINGANFTPCVSGGISPCAPSFDFLNIPRPQRAAPDKGAYELP